MITFYSPGQKGVPAGPEDCQALAARSVWIDLFQPTRAEEVAIEQAVGTEVPTREEMNEIELSRRLYRDRDHLFMTATVVTRSDSSHPESSAITFILGPERLVTVRYTTPTAFTMFASRWESSGADFPNAPRALIGMLDAIVERLADILEHVGASLDQLSLEVLGNGAPEPVAIRLPTRKKPRVQRDFKEVLRRIGRASDLASRARESLVSVSRLVAHAREAHHHTVLQGEQAHLHTVTADLLAMSDHATFLSGKVSFLLDATLGLINNDQNSIIKIVSVATLVFLPPTLVASIYGMNFEHMPELRWLLGYPGAIGMMVVSAILPYMFFKRKGWL